MSTPIRCVRLFLPLILLATCTACGDPSRQPAASGTPVVSTSQASGVLSLTGLEATMANLADLPASWSRDTDLERAALSSLWGVSPGDRVPPRCSTARNDPREPGWKHARARVFTHSARSGNRRITVIAKQYLSTNDAIAAMASLRISAEKCGRAAAPDTHTFDLALGDDSFAFAGQQHARGRSTDSTERVVRVGSVIVAVSGLEDTADARSVAHQALELQVNKTRTAAER